MLLESSRSLEYCSKPWEHCSRPWECLQSAGALSEIPDDHGRPACLPRSSGISKRTYEPIIKMINIIIHVVGGGACCWSPPDPLNTAPNPGNTVPDPGSASSLLVLYQRYQRIPEDPRACLPRSSGISKSAYEPNINNPSSTNCIFPSRY